MNPFKSATDYPSMRTRIAFTTFLGLLGAISVLRTEIKAIDAALQPLNTPANIIGVEMPLGTAIVAALLALMTHVFRTHDLISDLFRIRADFDVGWILLPLATGSGTSLDVDTIKRLRKVRRKLMNRTFYEYATSGGTAVIDKHLINSALDTWGYYWTMVEWAAIALITASILTLTGISAWAVGMWAGCLAFLTVAGSIKRRCIRYALDQVDAILNDADRRSDIKQAFCEV